MSFISSSEAIVIGAGIAGASAAFWLAERGVATTLLEREHPASGPTGNSTAVCHAFYLMPELSQLAARGVDILKQTHELTGEAIGFTEVGLLWAVDPDSAEPFGDAVERIRGEGIDIESLPPDELEKLAPEYNWDGVPFAVWEPAAGYIDPYGATNAFARAARNRGSTSGRTPGCAIWSARVAVSPASRPKTARVSRPISLLSPPVFGASR